ncbi:hypothetical protein, partial [Lysobacter sp. A3-1-A15]
LAQGFRPTYWDGNAYKTPELASTPVNSSPADVTQSELCDVCCRDHKDPAGASGPKFSPWPGQTSAHYRLDNNDNFIAVDNSGGAEYLEACRVIRVDGVFRVAADPKIQDNALVATRELDGNPTAAIPVP